MTRIVDLPSRPPTGHGGSFGRAQSSLNSALSSAICRSSAENRASAYTFSAEFGFCAACSNSRDIISERETRAAYIDTHNTLDDMHNYNPNPDTPAEKATLSMNQLWYAITQIPKTVKKWKNVSVPELEN